MEAEATFPRLSVHAQDRCAQRNLSLEDVEYVMEFGRPLRSYGARLFVLRGIDIPADHRRYDSVTRLEGTVVVASEDVVITVYRCHRRENLKKVLRRPALAWTA
jgi:hypothetical protein